MENNEFLQRLLILAEKQQENIDSLNGHICELENIVKAQQRTIDTLSAMAQPIITISGNGNNTNIGAGKLTTTHNGNVNTNTGTGTQNVN